MITPAMAAADHRKNRSSPWDERDRLYGMAVILAPFSFAEADHKSPNPWDK
ncbi:MAG: hypothetical protein H7243_08825 [Sphingomonadaceae bacterium]|nr:hypothetical protein [Sphingomonadaceae bacterium]